MDPSAEEGDQESLTPYQYGINNPIKYNDPDGKCPTCFVAAALDYGFQVYDNYQKNPNGSLMDNAFKKVNFVSVALSAVPGGGLLKTVALETAKAALKYTPEKGIELNTDIVAVGKEALINTAISKVSDFGANKLKVAGSTESLNQARGAVVRAENKVTTATARLARNPNSTVKAMKLQTAKIAAQSARNQQVRTQMLNKTVGQVSAETTSLAVSTTTTRVLKTD